MASSVFYKFRSQKDESRITFDGTGISVFDLKKEIILANGLEKANDFDLVVLDPSSSEEIKDDSHVIPRSSSVVLKRVPAARPGKGKAAMYIVAANAAADASKPGTLAPGNGVLWNKGTMSKRFDGKDDASKGNTPVPIVTPATANEDEAAAMAAMFQAQSANWEETQEKMSQATRIYTNPRGTGFGGRGGKLFQAQSHSDRPLPPSYVCYRCGKKGHWIQDCPTNSDREFDNKPRIKRTTGIPRSFLKPVESPTAGPGQQGVMVTPEGGYVVAQPDLASWQKRATRPKILTEADIRERMPGDGQLACPIDHKLFQDAVKTPCCGAAYCEECIQTHLLEKDFACPSCGTKIASLDKLMPDHDVRTRVATHIENEIEASKKERARRPGFLAVLTRAQTEQGGQELYMDPQMANDLAMRKMVSDSIPQLQAQIRQISQVIQNPSLPAAVRQQTEAQFQQLKIQLAQAQELEAAFAMQEQMPDIANAAAAVAAMSMMPGPGPSWAGPGGFANQQVQQQPPPDSAYQRLPVNNRRRNLKRERPSDFLEVAGPDGGDSSKVARYWE
ncbi:DWNN domain-containing protein [Vararia minispora EC-137]|uniref:DWNN domain-containing protein n=1 Tax=Vararia minispora EC-137 TaxID=1314806 RepID=A0ACB8QL11_9AGAM|nr:DWNN domain-containing protein [Vararia minispora EC-137]